MFSLIHLDPSSAVAPGKTWMDVIRIHSEFSRVKRFTSESPRATGAPQKRSDVASTRSSNWRDGHVVGRDNDLCCKFYKPRERIGILQQPIDSFFR